MPVLVVWLVEALLTALAWLFRTQAGRFVTELLVWLGIGLAVNHVVVGPALEYVRTQIGNVDGNIAAWLGIANVDKGISMILSAIATRAGVSAAKVFLARRV